jgi:hypothetical protein
LIKPGKQLHNIIKLLYSYTAKIQLATFRLVDKKEKVKQIGPTMKMSRLMTKLNLQREEILTKVITR